MEFGIDVRPISTVKIIHSGNYENQLIIPIEFWRKLIGKRVDIQRLLQIEKLPFSPLSNPNLILEFCKMYDSKIIKLILFNKCLYLKPVAVNILFTYEHYIDHMYDRLSENLHLVSIKFWNFVNVLWQKNIAEIFHATRAICESSSYNTETLVDCELLTYTLKDIMYEVINK